MTHAGDEALESYVLGTLRESDEAELEEHFLICEACRQQLQRTERFVRAMAAASRELRRRRPRRAKIRAF
jgi:anti-sigma factor RsiW